MNLFSQATPPEQGERFDELLRHRNLVIERILSAPGTRSAEYVQAQDEWVLLVQGEAELIVGGQTVRLTAGDHLFIPAGVPHTVCRHVGRRFVAGGPPASGPCNVLNGSI